MRLARCALLASIVVGLVGTITPGALAQTPERVPSVVVRPDGTTENDPNGGQWFVTDLGPGDRRELRARIFNPADVPQTVELYLADIRMDAQGLPEVQNVSSDIGTWGRFANQPVTVPAGQTVVESFAITAPEGADPGDHIGAVVAEHRPQGEGNILSIKRVAVRLYATLPGDARRDFEIDNITTAKDSAFFTRELTVTVQLRNTGRVRLEPAVQVDGIGTDGPELLMASAAEPYIVTRPVPVWGGPMRLRIDAQTTSLGLKGPVRQLRMTVWVIPWHLFALIGLAIGFGLGARALWRRRGSKYRAMQEDLGRIERLLAQQHRNDPTPNGDADMDPTRAAIDAAIKQARRAGDHETAARLELARTPRVKA